MMPSDSELNRIASGISEGYLKAVCSYASLAVSFPSRDCDNLGIDGYLEKVVREKKSGNKTFERPYGCNYRFQLKSCYSPNKLKETDDFIKYNIGEDYFEKIRCIDNLLIIILRLPPKENFHQWLEIQEDNTKIQKCAYFKQVSYAEKSNWIQIPKTGLLNPENLNKLFSKPTKLS